MSIEPLQAYRVRDWFALNGDQTYRLDYPLVPSSVVIDDGGFKGDFAAEIHKRYGCTVLIFEPLRSFCDEMNVRFARSPKIKVFPFGLGVRDEKLQFAVSDDASSSFKSGGSTVEAPIRSVEAVFQELDLSEIDLMKINVEGAEYETIEALVSSGLISRIRDLQVQFHDFVSDAETKLMHVRTSLLPTHAPTYMFSFVWENWRRIDGESDAALRQVSFITIDRLRETLHRREREVDELRLKAHWIDEAWKAETQSLRAAVDSLRPAPSVVRRLVERFRAKL